MFHQTRTTGRAFWLAVVVALLAVSTSGVLAARGGKPQPTGTPATLTFDDLLGDAIKSDGLGSYDATIENGFITLSTGKKRKLSFDFGSSTGETISNSSLTVDLLKGTAFFEFRRGGGDQILSVGGLGISSFDDDGDGITDRYVIETTGEANHALFRHIERGGRGVEPGSVRFEWIADFSMPWGIEVVVD